MKIHITTSKIAQIVRYIAVYVLLLTSSGFHIYAQGYHIPIMMIAAILLLLMSRKQLDIKVLVTLTVLIVVVIISGIVNEETARNMILPGVDILCGGVIAFSALSSKENGEFIVLYKNTVLAISVFSMIAFAIGAVANSLFSIFPVYAMSHHEAYFVGLTFIYKSRPYLQYRNMGIFWEPGAFQTYLIVAMILQDRIAEKHKIRNLIIYTLAMITTVSTTGLVCLLLFWILFILKNKNKKASILVTLCLLLCCVTVIQFSEILPKQLQFSIVEKLRDLLNGDQELQTVQTRVDSVIYPLRAFAQYPLFGVSKTGMSAWKNIVGHGINTCTPVNWFAHYGIVMGVTLLAGFGKFFGKISEKKWVSIGFLLIFLLSISTEAFNYNPTLLCFAFMGISGAKNLLPGGNHNESISG